jgi:photosystem II stability/assembly factor-like uncharacterized protein
MKTIIKFSILLSSILSLWISPGFSQEGWYAQNSGTQDWLIGVWFFNNNTGIVVGGRDSTCILRTTDEGETWSRQKHNGTAISGWSVFSGVCFSDSLNGWVVGRDGTIQHSRDGGISWTRQFADSSFEYFYPVFCVDTSKAWIGGSGIRGVPPYTLIRTTDGGETWDTCFTKINSHPWDIYFLNPDTGYVVWGWCDPCYSDPAPAKGSFIYRTTNGGDSWTLLMQDTTIIGLYGISFTDDHTATAVGSSGKILHTADGGETWTPQTSGTEADLWDVFFISADTGWAVGGTFWSFYGGVILKTTDGGTTWIAQTYPGDAMLFGVFFTDANTGTAVSGSGDIFHTKTGGVPTWIKEYRIDEMPQHSSLSQNYPNPFDQSTNIKFEIPESEFVTIKIYDIDGKLVTTLVNEKMRPGSYEVAWNAANYPVGVYFCRLKAGSDVESMSMEVVR